MPHPVGGQRPECVHLRSTTRSNIWLPLKWLRLTYDDRADGGFSGRLCIRGHSRGEIQARVDSALFWGTWKYRMIRTGQIDGLMAFKWQGRLISVPVCMQTMQGQKIMTCLQMKPCFLCPYVHVKLPLMMNNNKEQLFYMKTTTKQGIRLLF